MKRTGCVLDGQVTVYAALSLSLVISLVCACIQSVKNSLIYSEFDMAAALSVESVFAGYENDVLDEFDIMVLGEQQGCNEKLEYYAKFNTENICGKGNVKYLNAEFSDLSYMTDNGGEALKQQAVKYMKYGELSNIAASVLNIEKETEKSECISEITQDIQNIEEQLVYMDEVTLKLLSLVEGIKTDNDGIVIRNGKPAVTGEYFAKAVIMQPISPQTAAVDNAAVYEAVCGMGSLYTDVSQVLKDMRDNISLFEETGEDDVQEAYKSNYDRLKNVLSSVLEKTEEAISLIDIYDNKKDDRSNDIKACIQKIKNNRELLGDELCDTMLSDFDELNREAQKNSIYDAAFMRAGLESNYQILNNAVSLLFRLDVSLAASNSGENAENISLLEQSLNGIGNKLLKFNYSGIDFGSSENKLGIIKKIKRTLEKGISEIVLEGMEVSDRSFAYQGLAENYISGGFSGASVSPAGDSSNNNYSSQNNESVLQSFMYCEYILEHFPSFMDKEEWSAIIYPLEYIIAGHNSDRENINSVIAKLSIIREGVNMSHLLLDSKKRNEAFALAGSLVGFTGSAAVIKAAQYLIMGVWAYGESLIDIRRLFKGEELPIVKTASDWRLSLENLLTVNFDGDDTGNGSDGSVTDRGRLQRLSEGKMNYIDYLEILLMLMGEEEKNYRTMTAMELRMISMGHSDFRMSRQIYKAAACIHIEQKRNSYMQSEIYEKTLNYGYI